jgi:hypothetical protein
MLPLMLGKATLESLGLILANLNPCPHLILTSMGKLFKKVRGLTKYKVVI